jgi:PhzF family phenazine biosynthesis protein
VVLEARGLSDAQMQLVARELGHSETAFLFPSGKADYRIRFFTPAREVDLCGHASVAAAWVLASEGRLKRGRARQETNAGVLDLEIARDRVTVELAAPRVEPTEVRPDELAAAIGAEALDPSRPIQKAYAGVWVLVVPMGSEKAINLCQPAFGDVAALSLELGVAGTHLFAMEPGAPLYTRFFAPAVGIPEDPVTGVANGALGGYLVLNGLAPGPEFRVRQGDALGRPGELVVHATSKEVRVGGPAVILSRGTITF